MSLTKLYNTIRDHETKFSLRQAVSSITCFIICAKWMSKKDICWLVNFKLYPVPKLFVFWWYSPKMWKVVPVLTNFHCLPSWRAKTTWIYKRNAKLNEIIKRTWSYLRKEITIWLPIVWCNCFLLLFTAIPTHASFFQVKSEWNNLQNHFSKFKY